jgi:hypothetical protein
MRIANSAAAKGSKTAPWASSACAFSRCWKLGDDFSPVALQFFSNQLRQAGQRALTHFRTCYADDYRVVWLYHHPGIYFRVAFSGIRISLCQNGKTQTYSQSASDHG